MRFGRLPLQAALGAILAHSEQGVRRKVGKGQVLGAADLEDLAAAGLRELTVAQPDPGDVTEDAAALRLARALLPDPAAAGVALSEPHAGRVNVKALGPGIVALDTARIHALNRIHPAVTLATLPPFARVAAGTLVGTVKIIDYAVPETALAGAEAMVAAPPGGGALSILPVRLRSAGLVMTEVPGQPAKLNDKGRRAIAGRLSALGMTLESVVTVPHDMGRIAAALAELPGELLLILTGSATSDLRDDAPEALRQAGGQVARFGMPVDPGNLLFHGTLGGRPVIGLPGCARSPALNGADWVLERMACGLPVTDDDIAAMGVGGLLKEIPIRPHPRERPERGRDGA